MDKIKARLPGGVGLEVWWQDEARIGQKNRITRRWAGRGTRPRAAHDQRTKWAYIFGAICPEEGKGAGLILPGRLEVPANISLLPLPPRAPELNPMEKVWQFMRDNWLSNRVFASRDDIVAHCCDAWNKLVEQPWTIMSIGLRDWANGF